MCVWFQMHVYTYVVKVECENVCERCFPKVPSSTSVASSAKVKCIDTQMLNRMWWFGLGILPPSAASRNNTKKWEESENATPWESINLCSETKENALISYATIHKYVCLNKQLLFIMIHNANRTGLFISSLSVVMLLFGNEREYILKNIFLCCVVY